MRKIKQLFRRLYGLLPGPLPKGLDEFNSFALSIFDIYHFPDSPSYRHAIATMIMHLPSLCSRKSKAIFAKGIRKSISNEVAFEVLRRLREDEKAKVLSEPKGDVLIGQDPH